MFSLCETNRTELTEFELYNGNFFDVETNSFTKTTCPRYPFTPVPQSNVEFIKNYSTIYTGHNNFHSNIDRYEANICDKNVNDINHPLIYYNLNNHRSELVDRLPSIELKNANNNNNTNYCYTNGGFYDQKDANYDNVYCDNCHQQQPQNTYNMSFQNVNLYNVCCINQQNTNTTKRILKNEYKTSMKAKNIASSTKNKRHRKRFRDNLLGHKGHRLWEFIRDILAIPKYEGMLKWENKSEGVFRLIDSEGVAKLWGRRKNNTLMTYEKLSRAMRTYYSSGILVPVPKNGKYPKKLVYKFGPIVGVY